MIFFMRYKWLYGLISAIFIIPGLFSLIRFGLRPAIDFTGGSLLEIKITNLNKSGSIEQLKEDFKVMNTGLSSIQKTQNDTFLIKMKTIDQNKNNEIKKFLENKYGKINEIRFETVGPILGKELMEKTILAAVFAIMMILSYIAWAFKNIKFGIAAVIALFHDLLVVVGSFSLLGMFYKVEVDSLFVTAILTTMSFSVHDTIVVFDRIRETLKKNPEKDIEFAANSAIMETMGRSLNNSLTIIFMLLSLILLGGNTVKWFTFALLIGTITGTYSSPFVATPILVFGLKSKK